MPSFTITARSVSRRVADEINSTLERHFWLFAALFAVLLLVCAVSLDLRNKMWIDEIYTLHMAQQPSLGEIARATLEGCDGAPPLYAMVVHSILPWARSDALAVRLPSSLGFCGMAVCMLVFCRRRLGALYSFVAVMLLCNFSLFYATQGRCYGLVLGFTAAALLCWQTAADGRHRSVAIPLLAVSLALMTGLHSYCIFFLIPLSLAEMVRWRTLGKLDYRVFAAMTPAVIVLALHYPFIQAARQYQQHYWSAASWSNILNLFVYVETLLPLALLAAFLTSPGNRTASRKALTLPEWVTAVTLLLMPFCILVVSIYVTHIFVLRYTLWAEPGIAVLMAAMLCAAVRARSGAGVSVLCLLLSLLVFLESRSLLSKPVLPEGEAIFQALASLPDTSEPIVVADHHVFMELSYYAPLPLRDRLVYPVDRALDLKYMGFDTGALLMSALSHRSNLHIVGYDAFLASHPRFVLAALPKDYLPSHLAHAGYSLVPIGSSAPSLLYEVNAAAKKK